jgi:hypothetical protein
MKAPRSPRPPYSRGWLEQYGRTLTREEIRLVQAYRGLEADQRAALLNDTSRRVIKRAQAVSR